MIQNMELNSNKNINNKDNAGDESEQMNKQSRKTFHNQSEFGEKSNIQNLDIHTLFIWIFYRDFPLFVQNPWFVFAEVGEILCNLCNEPIVSVIMSCLKPFWDKHIKQDFGNRKYMYKNRRLPKWANQTAVCWVFDTFGKHSSYSAV